MKQPLPETILCALAMFWVAAPFAQAALSRPNILFVIADQWRAQAFGFARYPNGPVELPRRYE